MLTTFFVSYEADYLSCLNMIRSFVFSLQCSEEAFACVSISQIPIFDRFELIRSVLRTSRLSSYWASLLRCFGTIVGIGFTMAYDFRHSRSSFMSGPKAHYMVLDPLLLQQHARLLAYPASHCASTTLDIAEHKLLVLAQSQLTTPRFYCSGSHLLVNGQPYAS